MNKQQIAERNARREAAKSAALGVSPQQFRDMMAQVRATALPETVAEFEAGDAAKQRDEKVDRKEAP
jgi:hypothetical protein